MIRSVGRIQVIKLKQKFNQRAFHIDNDMDDILPYNPHMWMLQNDTRQLDPRKPCTTDSYLIF